MRSHVASRAREDREEARDDLLWAARAVDRALHAAGARGAVELGGHEERDHAGPVAGGVEAIAVAIAIEFEQRERGERAVEIAALRGRVEVAARLAPRRADVDDRLAALGACARDERTSARTSPSGACSNRT
jgi:hypothetical protein